MVMGHGSFDPEFWVASEVLPEAHYGRIIDNDAVTSLATFWGVTGLPNLNCTDREVTSTPVQAQVDDLD